MKEQTKKKNELLHEAEDALTETDAVTLRIDVPKEG